MVQKNWICWSWLVSSEVGAKADIKPYKAFPVLQYARDELIGKALLHGQVHELNNLGLNIHQLRGDQQHKQSI